jgi:hypothetical protein
MIRATVLVEQRQEIAVETGVVQYGLGSSCACSPLARCRSRPSRTTSTSRGRPWSNISASWNGRAWYAPAAMAARGSNVSKPAPARRDWRSPADRRRRRGLVVDSLGVEAAPGRVRRWGVACGRSRSRALHEQPVGLSLARVTGAYASASRRARMPTIAATGAATKRPSTTVAAIHRVSCGIRPMAAHVAREPISGRPGGGVS